MISLIPVYLCLLSTRNIYSYNSLALLFSKICYNIKQFLIFRNTYIIRSDNDVVKELLGLEN